MDFLRRVFIQFVFAFLLTSAYSVTGDVRLSKYGITDSDSIHLLEHVKYQSVLDSLYKAHPQLNNKNVINAVMHLRSFDDRSVDFYFLMILIIMLGLIRFTDPKYFQSIWQAFRNPTSSSRQLKDKLQSASVSNLLMNFFFIMSAAAYGYFVVKNFMPQRAGNISSLSLFLMLIVGMLVIYIGKYAVIKFSGWAFRVEGVTEYYLFNVFLVNKILAIVLLPIIVLLAFADVSIAQPALFISFLLIFFLFVSRYVRSWQVFGSFFQYSRFHFFTYLCASELLPLAVLMKFLVRGLLD